MLRLSAFFICLMLVLSIGLGSVAHATEGAACADSTAASSLDHRDGDADQVPADADKGYPHHHGSCHGHNVGVAVAAASVLPTLHRQVTPFAWRNEAKAPGSSDPALRPPQA